MALRYSRSRPLQDENAPNALISSGKASLNERKGLVERKKLSNITNQVQPQSKLSGKSSNEKECFSIKADSLKAARPPLKNLNSNGLQKHIDESICKQTPKQKPDGNVQNPSFHLPPRSKLNLTEEMKKKAALWAEEGIESVHFSGEDMEMLQKKAINEDIAKRVEMTKNSRIDIPFSLISTPRSFPWKYLDVLEPDILDDLRDDMLPDMKDMSSSNLCIEDDGLTNCMDYLSVCLPPRFTEGWPQINEQMQHI